MHVHSLDDLPGCTHKEREREKREIMKRSTEQLAMSNVTAGAKIVTRFTERADVHGSVTIFFSFSYNFNILDDNEVSDVCQTCQVIGNLLVDTRARHEITEDDQRLGSTTHIQAECSCSRQHELTRSKLEKKS